MKTSHLVLIAVVSAGACGTQGQPAAQAPMDPREYHQQAWQEFERNVAAFNVADGIDRSEAEFLGRAYFVSKVSGCGFADTPEDRGGEWVLQARVGISGHREDLIRVNKRSGSVSYGAEKPMSADALIALERRRLRENLQSFSGQSTQQQVADDPEIPSGVSFGGGDGSSCEARVTIHGASGSEQGGKALYGWLRSHFPGHQIKQQGLTECRQHMTDRMTIVTSEGRELVLYFDVSEFYGKGQP